MAPEQASQDRRQHRAPSRASRELQDAARRSRPIADSALMHGAAITVQQLEQENANLRVENQRLRVENAALAGFGPAA